jgi:hypothetical protein
MRALLIYRICAFILACNYFAFRVELFEEEREANEPKLPDGWAFTNCSPTWETFDKDNAPKAFVINVDPTIEISFIISPPYCLQHPNTLSFDIIRDKSPPR